MLIINAHAGQIKEAGNDLEVISHPVVDFIQKNLFLSEGCLHLFLRPLAVGDIPKYGMNEIFTTNENSPGAYLDIPYLATLCPVFRLK
jgi:hypothetical protein